ncbi:acyltransferase family protein [Stutzerimonas kunmingensis]|jgi:peptidoglycan/LPS O-acetylase OafA/YrhL|uniref:acyltransferase family protein n=1 Tax=Stutzerimonas kunmingensis TaxID=1211807 RepID=UPI00241E46DE|nr:acyltransferase [Stutzerimonas kunmingensis]|tara:strand:- start:2214 stop:3275 length:1062 start_codon:yes stop_codon:yes gene_type:complete
MTSILYPSQHLPAADGIRGVACLIVLLTHGIAFCWPESMPWLRGSSKTGVWLFFVLSAFLLTLRLQHRGFGFHSLYDYALGRCLRILPLFVVACMLYYGVDHGIRNDSQLWSAITFQQGFIHLWTIPAEFKFYLILPPLAWTGLALQRRFGDLTFVFGGITVVILHQSLWPYWLTPESSIETRWYLPSFMLGIIAAVLMPRIRGLSLEFLATPYAVLTLAALLLLLPGTRLWLFDTPPSTDLLDKHLFFSLMWVGFVVVLVDGHGWAGRLLCSRPLAFVGAVSYSAYLFHLLIMLPLTERWAGQLYTYIAAVILSIGAGAAGYYLAERPLEVFRRRLTRPTASHSRVTNGSRS